MNYNRMTIKDGQVYKLKPQYRYASGSPTGGGAATVTWHVGSAAPRFSGCQDECIAFIAQAGAEFVPAGMHN